MKTRASAKSSTTDKPARKPRAKKADTQEKPAIEGEEVPIIRKRRTKFEIQAEKLDKELLQANKTINVEMENIPEAPQTKTLKGKKPADKKPQVMYTLKFNSPILPYAKFPLTQNKYIQDFLRSYEDDKDKIQKVIGVHFEKNSNSNAENAVGIEIEIIKKNNITIIESNTNQRYKVLEYNSTTNFS